MASALNAAADHEAYVEQFEEDAVSGYSSLIGWTIRFACPDGQILSRNADWLILERHGSDDARSAMLHLTLSALTDGQSLFVGDMGTFADMDYTTFSPASPAE